MNVGGSCLKNKAIGSSKIDVRNNVDFQIVKMVKKWQLMLDISNWTIKCESIDEMQVVDDLNGDKPGNEFVGIAINFSNRTGVIYYTRDLQEDDIVHELLHVRFPNWSEKQVNYWTDLLINRLGVGVLKLTND